MSLAINLNVIRFKHVIIVNTDRLNEELRKILREIKSMLAKKDFVGLFCYTHKTERRNCSF